LVPAEGAAAPAVVSFSHFIPHLRLYGGHPRLNKVCRIEGFRFVGVWAWMQRFEVQGSGLRALGFGSRFEA
jgi:hypothetical protein